MLTTEHTAQAEAVARETGWDLDDYAGEQGWAAVALGPVGVHRDSGALDRSNFDVIYAAMREQFGEAVSSPRFGHWGVGWVDEIAWDAGREDIRDYVDSWSVALADYPVADETAFCELEYVEAVETIQNCSSSSLKLGEMWYETSELLPDDWAEQTFSAMYDAGEDTSPDGMRGEAIERAMFDLSYYVPSYPLVELPID